METHLRVESSSFYIEKLAQTSRAENSNQHCDSVKVHQEPFRGGQIDILKNLSTSYLCFWAYALLNWFYFWDNWN